MARTKSDISNSAIRIFLQNVGKFYDEARDMPVFAPTKLQCLELLKCFDNQCCYCGTAIDIKTISQDHLIPMNKKHLGLHAWGNVVPCCRACNNEKQQRDWEEFLAAKSPLADVRKTRERRIKAFVRGKGYDPKLNLHTIADNLYQDVGEVTMTLIDLRYKQAAGAIKASLHAEKNSPHNSSDE